MTRNLVLPPIYRAVAIEPANDLCAEAARQARDGAADGTFLWARRADRADCAMVLEPDWPADTAAQISYVAMLGIGDALGAGMPAGVAVNYGWPDRILLNGGVVGGIRLITTAGDDRPAWLVAGVAVQLAGDGADYSPGRDVDRTNLYEEGCGEVGTIELPESFARHFLRWADRWQDDGFAPVRSAWLSRAAGLGAPIEIDVAGVRRAGVFAGIDDDGGLVLDGTGPSASIDLRRALRSPSWSL